MEKFWTTSSVLDKKKILQGCVLTENKLKDRRWNDSLLLKIFASVVFAKWGVRILSSEASKPFKTTPIYK